MPGDFAKRIREARIAAGLSQDELAKRCEPTLWQNAISRIESGRHAVSERTLETIAVALGMSVAELVKEAP